MGQGIVGDLPRALGGTASSCLSGKWKKASLEGRVSNGQIWFQNWHGE